MSVDMNTTVAAATAAATNGTMATKDAAKPTTIPPVVAERMSPGMRAFLVSLAALIAGGIAGAVAGVLLNDYKAGVAVGGAVAVIVGMIGGYIATRPTTSSDASTTSTVEQVGKNFGGVATALSDAHAKPKDHDMSVELSAARAALTTAQNALTSIREELKTANDKKPGLQTRRDRINNPKAKLLDGMVKASMMAKLVEEETALSKQITSLTEQEKNKLAEVDRLNKELTAVKAKWATILKPASVAATPDVATKTATATPATPAAVAAVKV